MTKPTALVVDTETTGTSVFSDQVVQLVAATVDENGDVIDLWEWFMFPRMEVPEAASAVHGFSTEWLRENGQDPLMVYQEAFEVFADHFDIPWIMFNMSFDLTILDAEFKRYGVFNNFAQVTEENVTLFDPIVVVRDKEHYSKNRLIDVATRYKLDFDPDSLHSAKADVELTARTAAEVARRHGFPTMDEQRAAHTRWTKGMREKFVSWGKTIEPGDLTGEWPYVSDPFEE